jgi:hypothetical protein
MDCGNRQQSISVGGREAHRAEIPPAEGSPGVIVAAALAGFVDTYSAAISIASLVALGKMNAADAIIPNSRGAFDQHDQQDDLCAYEWRALFRSSRGTGFDTGRVGGLGRRVDMLVSS